MKRMAETTRVPQNTLRAEKELSVYPQLLQTLLAARGIATREQAERFLHPQYERDISDPYLMRDMERAVERIFTAIDANEKIVVYADYDCDGIPGGVILHDAFKCLGYENVEVYIPHRHEEGYGLNSEAIEQFKKNDTALVVTVDCGIADVKHVARAQELGIDVIVTDHHLTQDDLPPAYAILNPKHPEDTYPDDMLAGAGVVFKLAQALFAKARAEEHTVIPEGREKWLLDMAGLATVADMVPLVGENRAIAHFGLKVLQKSKRPGLRALLKKIRVNQAHITEDDIGFMIAPRVNAASRMDHPIEAFRLLAADDEETATELAAHLQKINETRKGLVASMVKEARARIDRREIKNVLVVGDPRWQPGVLGLVANRLMEDYRRPTFVWGRGDSAHIKGSCRSDGTVNIVEVMANVSGDMFLDTGGHAASGGFSVSHEQVHFLEDKLLDAHTKTQKTEPKASAAAVDAVLSLGEVCWQIYGLVERLAPFGIGNPKPLFRFEHVVITEIARFGKAREHVRLVCQDETAHGVQAISFFADDQQFSVGEFAGGMRVSLAAHMEKSMFRGTPELRLRVIDIFAAD